MSEDANDLPPAQAAKALSPAAMRALAEAEQRRREAAACDDARAKELGREGLEPTRYGDWEKGGIASDF